MTDEQLAKKRADMVFAAKVGTMSRESAEDKVALFEACVRRNQRWREQTGLSVPFDPYCE